MTDTQHQDSSSGFSGPADVLTSGGKPETPLNAVVMAAENIARSGADELAAAQLNAMMPALARMLREGHKPAALALLQQIAQRADAPEEALCLLIEHSTDAAFRKSIAQRLLAEPQLGVRARRVLSTHIREAWPLDEQGEPLERLHAADRKEFLPYMNLIRHCARVGLIVRMNELLAIAPSFGPVRGSLVNFFAALDTGSVEEAFNIFMARASDHKDVPKHPGLRLAQMLGAGVHAAKRAEVVALLRQHHAGAPELANLDKGAARDGGETAVGTLRLLLRDHEWERAAEVYQGLLALPEPRSVPARLAMIFYLSGTGQIGEARAALEKEKTGEVYPLPFLPMAIRIFGEAGAWDEVYDACRGQFEAQPAFATYYPAFVTAARRTGRQKELLDLLGSGTAAKGDARRQAIAALVEDLAETGEDVSSLISLHGLSPERRMRTELKSVALPARLSGAPDLAICFCTDAAYFTPALVSIVSFGVSNSWLARRTRIVMLAGADAEPQLPRLTAAAGRLGLSLDIRKSADLVSSAHELSGRYGFFTGGQALSSAAFYRIFLARALASEGKTPQVLYVDADTVIQNGLEQLFDVPMTAPLMARPDADRAEIKALEKNYGLTSPYFNSGVLRFDFNHPGAVAGLDRAIAAATDRSRTLSFHDQCALNIGFNGQSDVLPERFNWFASPDHLKPGQRPEDGVIIHYLDRTKPWDSLYQGDAALWFMYHGLARRLAELG